MVARSSSPLTVFKLSFAPSNDRLVVMLSPDEVVTGEPEPQAASIIMPSKTNTIKLFLLFFVTPLISIDLAEYIHLE